MLSHAGKGKGGLEDPVFRKNGSCSWKWRKMEHWTTWQIILFFCSFVLNAISLLFRPVSTWFNIYLYSESLPSTSPNGLTSSPVTLYKKCLPLCLSVCSFTVSPGLLCYGQLGTLYSLDIHSGQCRETLHFILPEWIKLNCLIQPSLMWRIFQEASSLQPHLILEHLLLHLWQQGFQLIIVLRKAHRQQRMSASELGNIYKRTYWEKGLTCVRRLIVHA